MSEKRIFVSSLHSEFSREREDIQNFVNRDPAIRDFFELLIPEPARSGIEQPHFTDVEHCDIFIGLIGKRTGPVVRDEKTLVELEFEQALKARKLALIFVKGLTDHGRDARMTSLIRKIGAQVQYRRFSNKREFDAALRDGLMPHLQRLRGLFGDPDAESEYKVYFAANQNSALPEIPRPGIVFSPADTQDNEFNIKTHFDYAVFLPMQGQFIGKVHLAFVDSDEQYRNPADSVAELIRQNPGTRLLPASNLPEFFTLLPDMQAYRSLIREAGDRRAVPLLSAMGDLVVLNGAQQPPVWLKDAMRSDAFNFAFMRSFEAYFALKNAASLFSGLEHEELSGISKTLRLRFHLFPFTNAHQLDFSFEHQSPLPKRIAVIIGKNGVGKSQSLSRFVDSLLAGDTECLSDPNSNRPTINRLLAVSSPGETYTTFQQPPRFPERIKYQRIQISRRQRNSDETSLGDTLVQLSRSEESIKGNRRWNLFCKALSTIVPLDQIFVQVRKRRTNGSIANRDKEPFPLTELQEGSLTRRLERWSAVDPQADLCRWVDGKSIPFSSGQITFMRFAAQVCLLIENGTMLLYDEPETHLHPNLVGSFISLLDNLLIETGSFAILATHSVYFVREMPRSQVLVLRSNTPGIINIGPPRLKTFGAGISAISAFVFEEDPCGYLLSELGQEIRQSGSGASERLKQLEDELSPEAIMHLTRAIKDGNKQ